MQDTNNKSPQDDKKVAEGTSTGISQGDNKQSDKDKSSPKADTQPDKVAEGAAPAYNQSVNKRSDTDISQPEDEMERYATKGDLKALKKGIIKSVIKKMGKIFATKTDMALLGAQMETKIEAESHKTTKFLVVLLLGIIGLIATVVTIGLAILEVLSKT